MLTMVKKAFKYRFYPTDEQKELLSHTFGCTRFVYNYILKWRMDAYYNDKTSISYMAASLKLTEIKKTPEFIWLNNVSCTPLQQCLRHQQTAYRNFFSGRAKYPSFREKSSSQSIELTKNAFSYKEGEVYMAKCKERLHVKWSRVLPCSPSSITISKDSAGRYFVSCLCDHEPEILPVTPNIIGIDLGLTHLAITDKGVKFNNYRHTKKYADKLAKAQRILSKKKLGSANRDKARIKVARVHAKIADSRRDNLHKLSRKLINENQVVCIESLKVKNMIKNPNLGKHIADASWGEFVRQLEYKGKWAGRQVVKIDQFFPSSKRCSDCGHVRDKLPLDIRKWDCPECGSTHDRDINAAINIKAAGLAVLASGENVRAV